MSGYKPTFAFAKILMNVVSRAPYGTHSRYFKFYGTRWKNTLYLPCKCNDAVILYVQQYRIQLILHV